MREMVVLQEMRGGGDERNGFLVGGGDERNGCFAEEEDRTCGGVRERAVG
jgi:hypothetical protein